VETFSSAYFFRCAITTLNIGAEVTQIPDYAFYVDTWGGYSGNNSIRNIYTNHSTPLPLGTEAFGGITTLSNRVVHLPSNDYIPLYLATDVWKDFSYAFTMSPIIYGISTQGTQKIANVVGLIPEYTGSIAIPSTIIYDGEVLNVTSIIADAFRDRTGLTSVTIANGLTDIGNNAFFGCTDLTTISLPNSVTTVGNSVFRGCTSLTSIDVESGNNTYASINGVLFNKSKDTLVLCPEGKIGNYVIPNGVTNIKNNAFYFSNLASISISNGVTTLENQSITNCPSLISIYISNSVTSIGSLNFIYCPSLISIDVESENSTYCSDNGILFNKNKSNLIYYPDGITTDTYVISNIVKTIDQCAFSYCIWLTTVTIPNSVDSIKYAAFWGCSNLTMITNHNSEPIEISYDVFNEVNKSECTLKVPMASVSAYQNANVWKDFNIAGEIGIFTIEAANIKIYPNPTNDKFVIDCENFNMVKLYDMLGKEVLTQTVNGKTEINISHLPKGIYSVQILSGDSVIGKSKIVKQ